MCRYDSAVIRDRLISCLATLLCGLATPLTPRSWIVFVGTHEIHLAEIVSKPDHSIFKFQSKQAGLLLSNWGLKLLNVGGASVCSSSRALAGLIAA